MGVFQRLKLHLLRLVRVYDTPYAYMHLRNTKGICTSQQIKQLQNTVTATTEPRAVKVWFRNLDGIHKNIPAIKRLGHWAIQVGDTFYELHLPQGPFGLPELAITRSPNHPFEGHKCRQFHDLESTTTLSPEAVTDIVRQIFDSEFEARYVPGMEDCHRLCMNIWKGVVRLEDRHKADALYYASFSFALAYSTASPPTHLTTPKAQVSSVPQGHRIITRDTGRGLHGRHHGSGHSGGIASQNWFLAALATPPPR